MQSEGQQLPSDSAGRAALRRQILTQMVEDELLVQQAQRDTNLKVTDREVQDQVEQTVQNVRKQFTSGAEFQSQLRAAGFGSEEEWRRWLADNQRRSILRDRLLDELRQKGKLRPIPPSESQLRAFWEQNRGQQSKRPASVSFRQIVIAPKPDSAAKARARQLAESLVVVLRGGADFADVARRFSSDSGSREAGGELGWFRRGRMVKEFEDVAFRMRPGEISGVVETQFGYHIIQVERVQPAEVEARHVLIAPVISAAQLALARRLADSVHDALAGGASFDSLARRYHDPNEPKLADALPASQLPPDYLKAIGNESVPGLKPVIAVAEGTARARPADIVVLGNGERGAEPSAAPPRPAPRSLLPEVAGRIAGEAVEEAVRLALTGEVDAIVTGPVHKHALHLAGYRYPGLTEMLGHLAGDVETADRKSTRLNSSHLVISYAVFCLKKKKKQSYPHPRTAG